MLSQEEFENELKEAKEQYMLSLFTSIEIELTTKFKETEIKFFFAKNFSEGRMILKVRYKKRTNFNPSNKNIDFLIYFTEYFPVQVPRVLCVTNFTFPSISDGRDLFVSLFQTEWKSNFKATDIVVNIYNLILRSLVYNKIQIYTNVGKFYLNQIYDMNEIFFDVSNELFKVYIESEIYKNSKIKIKPLKRYIVISDSQMMIFEPLNNSKNQAVLLHSANLYLIEDLIVTNLDKRSERKIKKFEEHLAEEHLKRFIIIWKINDIYIPNNELIKFDYGIIMKIDNFFHFNDLISIKKKKLMQTFDLYSDDYHKFFPLEKMNLNDESKLVEICMYQEKLFFKDYIGNNPNLKKIDVLLIQQAKEIIYFYKKLIDLMNYKNDNSVLIYRNKLREFMELTGYVE